MAASCVHQIRNRIEAVRRQGSSFVLAVSSPYQGDGKTNIALALGWSYAAAGRRTLLVDCDLVGQSLTRQVGMGDRAGLKEVLRERHLDGRKASLHVANLSILPAGADRRVGPEFLHKQDLEQLFDELRQEFDVVIVDTGPVLGSLEGIPAACAADGVLLSLRRGRRRSRLEECIAQLEVVGASYLGVVLNCAARAECDRYTTTASQHAAAADKDICDTDPSGRGLVSNGSPRFARSALMAAMDAASCSSESDDRHQGQSSSEEKEQ